MPQQSLFGDAFGNPGQAALVDAAEKRFRFLDRRLMPGILRVFQLLMEFVTQAGKESLAVVDRFVLLDRFVITLPSIVADGHEIHVHYCFGRRIGRGVRANSVGIRGLPAASHAPVMNDATAEIESFNRRSSVGNAPLANAAKYPSS